MAGAKILTPQNGGEWHSRYKNKRRVFNLSSEHLHFLKQVEAGTVINKSHGESVSEAPSLGPFAERRNSHKKKTRRKIGGP